MPGCVWTVTLGGETFNLRLTPAEEKGAFALEVVGGPEDSGKLPVRLQHVFREKYLVNLGNRSAPVLIERVKEGYRVVLYGHEFRARVEDGRLHRLKEAVSGLQGSAGPSEVTAPMPGLVVSVEVAVGDDVARGQGVVVIESMKMENEIRSGADGRVERILVEPGQAVEKGQTLIRIASVG
jgi:biotin carboxyl carrier protein